MARSVPSSSSRATWRMAIWTGNPCPCPCPCPCADPAPLLDLPSLGGGPMTSSRSLYRSTIIGGTLFKLSCSLTSSSLQPFPSQRLCALGARLGGANGCSRLLMPSTQVAVRDFCCCHSAMADGVYAYSVILFRASGELGVL